MSVYNDVRTLIFSDTDKFQSWLKGQKKTTFSVPIRMIGSSYSFQFIAVTKRAMERLTLCADEIIQVELTSMKYGGGTCAFVEPKRVRGEKK